MERGKGRCLSLGDHCFCLSYAPGHDVSAAAWFFHCHCTRWSLSGHRVAFVAPASSFPCPASPTCSSAWIFWACLCVEQGILCCVIFVWLINFRGETQETSALPSWRLCHSLVWFLNVFVKDYIRPWNRQWHLGCLYFKMGLVLKKTEPCKSIKDKWRRIKIVTIRWNLNV